MDDNPNNNSKRTFTSRRTLALALFAATMCTAGVLVAEQPALAQTSNSTGTNGTTTPTIKGSVSISNATNAFVKANVKIDFNTAANTAKAQMPNSVVIGGRLSNVQGYLVYSITVANYDAGTSRIVIVDAGNGSVLYTSSDMPLYNGGVGGGCHHGGFGGGYGMGHHMNSGSASSPGTTGTSGLSVPGSNNL